MNKGEEVTLIITAACECQIIENGDIYFLDDKWCCFDIVRWSLTYYSIVSGCHRSTNQVTSVIYKWFTIQVLWWMDGLSFRRS